MFFATNKIMHNCSNGSFVTEMKLFVRKGQYNLSICLSVVKCSQLLRMCQQKALHSLNLFVPQ